MNEKYKLFITNAIAIKMTHSFLKRRFVSKFNKINNIDNKKRIQATNAFDNKLVIPYAKHYNLFYLFKELITILQENNIDYVIAGGVGIGIYRHNSTFIPWDDDVDIYMFPKDITLLKEFLQTKYKSKKMCMASTYFRVTKITLNNPWKNDDTCFIDIFPFDYNKKADCFRFSNIEHRMLWKKQYYKKSELVDEQNNIMYMTKSFRLYGIDGEVVDSFDLKIPVNLKTFLNRAYPNWENNYCYSHSHNSFFKMFPRFHLEKDQ